MSVKQATTKRKKDVARASYLNIMYSTENYPGYWDASSIMHLLKDHGIKARTAHSCYVGQRTIEIDLCKMKEAIKVLKGNERTFVAECAKDAFNDWKMTQSLRG